MPFARWIRNKNDRLVCVWNGDMKMSPVYTGEILPLVKGCVGKSVVAISTKVFFGMRKNSWQIKAKAVVSNCCKLAA